MLEPAFEMLATAVSVNNAMWQTVDTVKLVGSTLMGAMTTELVIKESSVKFVVVKEDDAGDKAPVAEIVGGTAADVKSEPDYKKVTDMAEANAAVEACSAQLVKLNDALKEVRWRGGSGVRRCGSSGMR